MGKAIREAVWSAAYINTLPDSSFLYIEPGGEKDEEGKTKPRSLRHFPVKNADGSVDEPHLSNALARIPQSNLPQAVKDRCKAAAQKLAKGKLATYQAAQRSFSDFVVFKEAQLLGEDRVLVRVIQPGLSANRNYYSEQVLSEGHSAYEGARVYLDHPTKQEEAQRPERSVRDLCGVLENVKPDMSAELKVVAHADLIMPFIEESISSGRDLVGLSHHILGNGRYFKHTDGKLARKVESIEGVKSVDIVTTAAAGGKFQRLLEAEGGMMVETLEELKEAYPELLEQFKEEVVAEATKESKPPKEVVDGWQEELGKLTEAIKERDGRIATLEEAQHEAERNRIIREALDESKLPKRAQERVRALVESAECPDDKLAERVAEAVKDERDYIASIAEGSPVQRMGGPKAEEQESAVVKEAREFLEEAMDVAAKSEPAEKEEGGE